MTTTKHTFTPGPWLIGKAGTDKAIYDGKGGWVATIPDMLLNDEQKANAHLIASAPDLLEALEEVLKSLEWQENILDGLAVQKAQAAIAKAKGAA